ncbi:pilus assembly protein TadG-related protein [Aliiruegeria lutimaris]|uniref:Putative Flp pilus-assembly TadE/G-like n=1 Tax=Aliiruegeria lutimaris TaxID=571298 RepID=A0A1G9JX75_9RHOB|nr:pilus assembly protein TadG-related protein [Aliiruegeria lutimaris]SDL42091.1 Putative Flp pilus-assembly TadE/G-like [Aliiruegeria lutimaris]
MKPLRSINDLKRDTRGTILVFWAMSLAVFLGIIALSFDLGRIGVTHTELQSFSDSVALAAAGELDGRADSITRATAAAANLISDFQTFGSGGRLLSGDSDYTLTFFEELPASDLSAMTAVTTDPEKAAYVRATTTMQTVDLSFAAAFSALSGNDGPDNDVRASAVAGFTMYACDITPMMFCVPGPEWSADEHVGHSVLLRAGGNGAAWGPGDFGFLDPENVKVDPNGPCGGLNNQQLDRCLLSAVGSITQCFVQRGVDMEPGQKTGIEDAALNVRFDMYSATMNHNKNDINYAPAPNVIDGIVTKSCKADPNVVSNQDDTPLSVPLPPDDCMPGCGRFGNGDWSVGRAEYETVNYAGADPTGLSANATRYEYYLKEIEINGGALSTNAILPNANAETGRPQCAPQATSDPDRRVIIAAGIDCAANQIQGAAENVPVQEFVKIFLIQPGKVSGTKKFDIYGEIVGSAGGTGGGVAGATFHDVVQLYR